MPCDLEVDTDRIRRAAALVALAAELADIPARRATGTPPLEHRAQGPDAFREAARLIAARTAQCESASASLAHRAHRLSGFLHSAASEFDRAERLCAAGG